MVKERRKSIAVVGDQNRPVQLARKRRPHSIVAGDVLSPRSKARRLAVPRKSILKSTLNLGDATTSLDPQSAENTASHSADFTTTDFQTQVTDNTTTRKSFGIRRVSFAKNAHVRLIEPNEENTNSTASPPASPAASSDPPDENPASGPVLNDENAYPGAAANRNRRRSSMRQSFGSEDMDLTVSAPGGFFAFGDGPAIADEDMEMDGSLDMDMTEDLDGEFIQQRAVSLGGNMRPPLAQVAHEPPASDGLEQSQSFEDSYTSTSSQEEAHTEYTIPVNHSLRPPASADPAWMALRSMTHSGDAPLEDPPPSSDDELGVLGTDPAVYETGDDTVSSTEDSFGDVNNGDRTVNLSQVLGRVSLAGSDPRFSIGQPNSTMEESEIYGSILPMPTQSTPAPATAARPPIFRPPSPPDATPSVATTKPIFFPPAAATSTNKRPRESDADGEKGTPAKRLAVAGRWTPTTTSSPGKAPTPKKTPEANKPKPLSPSKRAPFLVPKTSSTTPASSLPRPTGSLRRPSSYFGRRQSMAPTTNAPEAQRAGAPSTSSAPRSPKKSTGLGLGRASMGSAPSDAWKRFERPAATSTTAKGKEKAVEPEPEVCVRENERQAAASPTPSRGSPAPASPRPASPRVNLTEMGSSVVNVSSMADTTEQPSTAMDVDPTEQWREGIEQGEPPDEEVQPISIEQFFELTNVKFMDTLDAPRRSIHQPLRQARPAAGIPLAEYGIAMAITVPELDLYSKVSNDLQDWIDNKIKKVFAQEEEAAAKVTPQLFIEYMSADDEDREALLHQLDLIKSNVRSQAKSEWYDWKLQWIENLQAKLDEALDALRKDVNTLQGLQEGPDHMISELEQEYESLMRELEQEQAEVAEIENCDQDYLNELKASIAEQDIEVEALKAELAEHNSRLKWLQERTEEMEDEKRQAQTAINEANEFLRVSQNSTHAELARLKDEIELLQSLHMLRITKAVPGLFEYEYAGQFRVSIPCREFVPVPSKVKITRIPKTRTQLDDFPELTKYFFEDATRHVPQDENVSVRRIVASLSDYWSSCTQLRSQLFQLTIKYPLHIQVLQDQGFRARTTVMFPGVMGKAFIYFIFAPDVHGRWPMSFDYLTHEVEVVFGPLDADAISTRVAESLGQASPMDHDGCLLDACISAQELYAN
uniref:Spc7 kinetochore protein domain-containing protein n=1 Tax=Mycena chlorophos TaxID=658473 RepID=A0ABQ0KXT2_MYCCL|nr:predicted protein [Mycena chlorophos]